MNIVDLGGGRRKKETYFGGRNRYECNESLLPSDIGQLPLEQMSDDEGPDDLPARPALDRERSREGRALLAQTVAKCSKRLANQPLGREQTVACAACGGSEPPCEVHGPGQHGAGDEGLPTRGEGRVQCIGT